VGNVSDLRKHYAHTSCIAHIGDTLHRAGEPVEPMQGFQETKAIIDSSGNQGNPDLAR